MAVKFAGLSISKPQTVDPQNRATRAVTSAYMPAAQAAAELKPGQSIYVDVPKDAEVALFRNSVNMTVRRLMRSHFPQAAVDEIRFFTRSDSKAIEINRMTAKEIAESAARKASREQAAKGKPAKGK